MIWRCHGKNWILFSMLMCIGNTNLTLTNESGLVKWKMIANHLPKTTQYIRKHIYCIASNHKWISLNSERSVFVSWIDTETTTRKIKAELCKIGAYWIEYVLWISPAFTHLRPFRLQRRPIIISNIINSLLALRCSFLLILVSSIFDQIQLWNWKINISTAWK